MTLDELIQSYLIEEYDFYKYRDKDGNEIAIRFLFDTHADYLDKYLAFYKELPNLTEVIIHATDGIFKLTKQGVAYFIRHNHQEVFPDKEGNLRGVPLEISKQVRNKLVTRFNDILAARNFDEIINIIQQCKVKGFGELAIYDTAMRIGSFLNIEPDKVYLHAGARKGIEVLESKGYLQEGNSSKKFLSLNDLPTSLAELRAAETEHFLCSMKDKMILLDSVPKELPEKPS
jgi:hypothetical protein